MSTTDDDDLNIELPNGTKIRLNLSVREYIVVCITVAIVTYFYNL